VRIRLSLLVLTFAWIVLVPVPAMSQTGPSAGNAQYDQYDGQGPDLGDRAAHDVITALGAIRATSEEAQADEANAVSAAEAPDESAGTFDDSADGAPGKSEAGKSEPGESEETAGLEKLPDTGGPSPFWPLVPLLCAGGLFARRIL
jgi:hypothetical protein